MVGVILGCDAIMENTVAPRGGHWPSGTGPYMLCQWLCGIIPCKYNINGETCIAFVRDMDMRALDFKRASKFSCG